jgi:hypothetical protein
VHMVEEMKTVHFLASHSGAKACDCLPRLPPGPTSRRGPPELFKAAGGEGPAKPWRGVRHS